MRLEQESVWSTTAFGDVFEFAYRQTRADNRFIPTHCRCDECGPALHCERCHDHGLADAHPAKWLHRVALYAKPARSAKPEPHVWYHAGAHVTLVFPAGSAKLLEGIPQDPSTGEPYIRPVPDGKAAILVVPVGKAA